MKSSFKDVPFIGPIIRRIKTRQSCKQFRGSKNYWIRRYESGRSSGAGSYNKLAEFKAEVLNGFVKEQNISSVIEYGCGDGNQLTTADYLSYIGFDVSPKAIALCEKAFRTDPSKSFHLMDEYHGETAPLTISLDVIYHLVEDATFEAYMRRLFDSSQRFVVIYSSDTDTNVAETAPHVKHRKFTAWVAANYPRWRLKSHIRNKYPFKGNVSEGSFADFFIYEKLSDYGVTAPTERNTRP
ncbi:MAG: class I SAM-dependent methyltransferase [Gammaproteobacteria bacterium]|jgi:hypothetical protein|nr:class I SAM-dependent methyltransferase [Gammaproteobacteria bacterium]